MQPAAQPGVEILQLLQKVLCPLVRWSIAPGGISFHLLDFAYHAVVVGDVASCSALRCWSRVQL